MKMNSMRRNILAIVAGWIVGGIVNMGIVMLGHNILPIEGVTVTDTESYKEIMPTLETKYFIFPFLAHAVGTLIGAMVAYLLAVTERFKIAIAVGIVFFIGGIVVSFMIPAPAWFILFDLVFAYFPMAWLGAKLAATIQR